MSKREFQYDDRDKMRPTSQTEFGLYRAGFDNYPVSSDTGENPEEYGVTTVYWSYLDDTLLYRGFDVNAAFDAMERDFALKLAGSLNAVTQSAGNP